jgi:hypothetical protein
MANPSTFHTRIGIMAENRKLDVKWIVKRAEDVAVSPTTS